MPTFDLKHIRAVEYSATGEHEANSGIKVGDAMAVNLDLRFAEGRLYAEGSLAELLRNAIGGSATMSVKYLTEAAQKLFYCMRENTRTVNNKTVKSLRYGAHDDGKYVSFAFYAPDMIDKVKKFTCVLVLCAKFAPPAMAFQTKGENYNFQTPTTTGEFLPADDEDDNLFEIAIADDEETAAAWVDAVTASSATLRTIAPLKTAAAPDAAGDPEPEAEAGDPEPEAEAGDER